MGESDSKFGGVGGSIGTILQIIFAVLYYADPCHNNSEKECWTTIGNWQQWQVWLPTIIGASVLGVFCICGGIALCGGAASSGRPTNPWTNYGSTSV